MSTISVNGTTLYYDAAGHGLPIVFIHGMCGNADVWADQVARLSPRFHCVTYDRRGHTRSALGHIAARTVELHADDAAALIQGLALAPCLLVGSSGGARVGLDVVRRYPELLRGAVLSEPPVLALDPEGARAFMNEIKPNIERAVAAGGAAAAVARVLRDRVPRPVACAAGGGSRPLPRQSGRAVRRPSDASV